MVGYRDRFVCYCFGGGGNSGPPYPYQYPAVSTDTNALEKQRDLLNQSDAAAGVDDGTRGLKITDDKNPDRLGKSNVSYDPSIGVGLGP